ncbi:PaaI family thioesterase [Burkholderia ubonensis]|uniref:PaaI family thioesterase n=1 Tax=Burkholderia ubonensis TaxID=101571 RepID=UPI00075C642A|nr:PaaI family thioesterase [Burkholderia ubonensis]KVG21141.1 competence protein ComA [Burkholderia ubonensis]KVP83145.1 competence protein ComA [Burkholderia ubonensis]KVR59273.1 competence protein ComA [Burkholderia ubonensis]KVU60707.1 competence protein ComA [Burkholderia ubonensis]KWB51304.1 competence protein ComA [Burkholderia ubonensis]
MQEKLDADYFNRFGADHLPGLLGIVVNRVEKNHVLAELTIREAVLAHGILHAGTIVSIADTACGYGCLASLPEGASSFSTLELKSNFMGSARAGVIVCEASALHSGRMTQVWDATVRHRETDKLLATFRCTQMILWPTK